MKQCLKCGNNLPNIITIDGKKHNISNRKFCLDCSKIAAKLNCEPREIESAVFTWIQICRNGKKKERWQLKPADMPWGT